MRTGDMHLQASYMTERNRLSNAHYWLFLAFMNYRLCGQEETDTRAERQCGYCGESNCEGTGFCWGWHPHGL